MRRANIGWLGAGLAGTLGLLSGACGSGKSSSGTEGTGAGSTSSGTATTSSGTGAGSTSTTGSGGSTTTSSSSSSSSSTSSGVVGDSVLMHHKNPSRDGVYVQPTFTTAAIAGLKKDPTFNATVTGAVYAQPLFVDGGTGGKDLVIVVTNAANVTALDGASGAVAWNTNLGVPTPASAMKCGNINPFGVIGTPVIDFPSRTLYVDALVQVSGEPKHLISALSIDTGAMKTGYPVDVSLLKSGTTTFNVTTQGQRGALAIVNGTLYVPFGGLYGDCNPYNGTLVSVSLADPTQIETWATTLKGGGVWAPGGVTSDGTSIYIATGNTFGGSTTWGGGDGAVSFAATSPLAMESFFGPKNWLDLDNGDLDMGSAPIPFDLPGSTPSTLLITFGKDGGAYLLDRTNLGGVGAALGSKTCATNASCYTAQVATNEIITAPALYTTTTATYVTFKGAGKLCTSGASGTLATLKIVPGNPPTVAGSWCANSGTSSPIVTTSDGTHDVIVWSMGAEGDSLLHAYNGDTGAAITFAGGTTTIANMRRYNTPIAAKGRIFVPADGTVVAFTL